MIEVVSRAVLEAEATVFERSIRMDKLATEAELSPWRPGGERNPDESILGVLRWYGKLRQFHARAEGRQVATSRDQADATLLDALQETPEAVTLRSPVDGRDSLAVHPKGFSALLDCRLCERRIEQFTATAQFLEATDRSAARRFDDGVRYYYALFVWITTHEGPGVPYQWHAATPEPPAWCYEVNPFDLLLVIAAHLKVNVARLQALTVLTHPDPIGKGGPRPTWSEYFASLAAEKGDDPIRFMRDRSLANLIATHALAAERQRAQMQASDAARGN
jgi:hypothetical protein